MPSIFDLELDLQRLRQMVESNEQDSDSAAQLDAWITSAEGDLHRKIEGYCAVIGELEAIAEARTAESKRLANLASTDTNNVARMKSVLKGVLQRLNMTKVETTRYKVRLQTAGGKQRVTIDPFAEIPSEYVITKTTTEINVDAIREALNGGEVFDFAQLEPRGTFITIR